MLPQWITNPDPNIFLGDNYVVLDFETTNISKGNPREAANSIVLSAWRLGSTHPNFRDSCGARSYSRFGTEYEQRELVQSIELADFIVAHNAKFEIGWLQRCGIRPNQILSYDTLIGQYVIAGNRRWRLDLNSVAAYNGLGSKDDFVSKLIKSGVNPLDIPAKYLEKYCIKDVELTEEIFLRQRQELYEDGLLPTMFTRCLFTPVLVDIESNGMFLDADRVEEKYKELTIERQEIEEKLDKITGGINMRSPQQVAEFIYETLKFKELRDRKGNVIRGKPSKRFPEGAPKTDEATLAALTAVNKRQREFIELKRRISKLNKIIDTYVSKFKYRVECFGSHIYGTFNQTVTQTHRISSNNPNLQNFDRTLKPLFTSRNKGWKIGERDASQLEFRTAVELGDDTRGRADIKERVDVHAFTASIIGCSRQDAKPHTFKPLYGGQSGTEAEQRYYKTFREKYPDITAKQEEWKFEVLRSGKLKTITGLVFYWPDTRMTHTGYITNSTSICNYPVQSFATADIIPIATVHVWHYMKALGLEAFIVNVIHDSIITEEPENEGDVIDSFVTQALTKYVPKYLKEVYNIDFTIPLESETKIANNWEKNNMQTSGVVEVSTAKTITSSGRNLKSPLYSFKVGADWFNCGFKNPGVERGENITFEYKEGPYGKDVDVDSIVKTSTATSKITVPISSYLSGGDRQNSIIYQSSRKDAIEIAKMALAYDLLTLPTKKADKLDALLLFVGALTDDFATAALAPEIHMVKEAVEVSNDE